MMRKIMHAVTGAEADAEIRARLASGRNLLGGVVLTEQELAFSKGLRRVYLPYSEIVWAYRRIEESRVTLGCCGGVLEEFKVMLRHESGTMLEVKFDREPNAIATLETIARGNPSAAIGYTEEHKANFQVE